MRSRSNLRIDRTPRFYTVELDTEAIAEFLVSKGTDIEGWDAQKLKEADTGSHVFILVRCKILDAIEDIDIRVEI